MMKFRFGVFCILLIISLQSCIWMKECYPEFNGIVLSKITQEPIEGATVQLLNQKSKVKTDKNGYFRLSGSGCNDRHLKISMEGYKPFEMSFSNSSNSIGYNVKSESIFVEYDSSFSLNREGTDSLFTTGTWVNQNSKNFSVFDNKVTYYLDSLKSITEELIDLQNQIAQ